MTAESRLIEKVARAMYEEAPAYGTGSWVRAKDAVRNEFRDNARVAVTTVLDECLEVIRRYRATPEAHDIEKDIRKMAGDRG